MTLDQINAHRARYAIVEQIVEAADRDLKVPNKNREQTPVEFTDVELDLETGDAIYIVRLTSYAAGILMESMARVRQDERRFWNS